jgi:23S rRNA pseudoU1915 N3-methylase RlmH
MATIASLGVSLTARIGNFEKGFKKAQRTVMRFGSDLARHTTTIAKYGAALVSVAAGAIAYFTKQQFEAVDSTAKMARTLGTTGAELSAFEHAAKLAGVGQEALHQSLMRMNRMVTGGGSTSERLAMVADQYANLSSETERAKLLQEVFGRGAKNIGNLLEGGSKGIAQAVEEAERLGLSFSELDSRKIEEANDSITRVKAVIAGAARTLAIQLSPFVIAASNKLIDMGTSGEGMGEKVVNAFEWVMKAVGRLADWFELLKAGFYGFQSLVIHGAGIIISIFALIAKAIQSVINLIPGMKVSFGDNLVEAMHDFKKAGTDAFDNAVAAYDKFESGINSKKVENLFEKIKAKADEVAQSTSNIGAGLEDIIESADKARQGEGRQVDLSRIVIGSQSQADKPVNQKQGVQMVDYLSKIARNTSDMGVLIS